MMGDERCGCHFPMPMSNATTNPDRWARTPTPKDGGAGVERYAAALTTNICFCVPPTSTMGVRPIEVSTLLSLARAICFDFV